MFGGFTQTKIEVHINLISENAVNLLLCYIIAIPTKNKKKKKKRGNPSNNCIGSSGEVIAQMSGSNSQKDLGIK